MATYQLRVGVDVYGVDGTKIGRVRRVFSAAPEAIPSTEIGHSYSEESIGWDADRAQAPSLEKDQSASLAMDRATAVETGSSVPGVPLAVTNEPLEIGDSGQSGVAFGPSDTKYLEVHHGGIFGVGGESLYVPFAAVKVIEGDGSVFLCYSALDAASLFSQPPGPLDAA